MWFCFALQIFLSKICINNLLSDENSWVKLWYEVEWSGHWSKVRYFLLFIEPDIPIVQLYLPDVQLLTDRYAPQECLTKQCIFRSNISKNIQKWNWILREIIEYLGYVLLFHKKVEKEKKWTKIQIFLEWCRVWTEV